jgi:hypothetical protein
MRLFKNKRRAALSTAPGSYAEEDPSKVIFETSTRLKLEANRWMLISFGLGDQRSMLQQSNTSSTRAFSSLRRASKFNVSEEAQ